MVEGQEPRNPVSGTTEFLNDEMGRIVTRDQVSDVPSGLLAATRVGYSQDIRDFLAKPVQCATATWQTTTARGSVLIEANLPEDQLSSDVYSKKIYGFLGFRFKAVVRIQVNGNRFQAGRLLVVFVPQGHVNLTYPGMRIRSLTAATQLPRVELDLSSETEVLMELPYVAPTPYYNRVDGTGALGKLYVMIYSPLATGAAGTQCNVTLWCSYEDVELVAPIAQMANGRPKRRAPPELENQASGEKPISGGLRLASQAAASFAKIPMLSWFAGTASWVLECAGGVASAFGYSKPSSEAPETKVSSNFQFHLQNSNGTDLFPVMGLDGSNKLDILPGFAGTDIDEMSLTHLVQIPAYVSNASWSTSTTPGTSIWSNTVHPQIWSNTITSGLWTASDMTPVTYFSQFFNYWRGSFIVTIKIVKTSFHSGRLLFVYDPSGAPPTITSSAYCMREVMDVRTTNQFRFAIPYVSTRQYSTTGTYNPVTFIQSIGAISVLVLNELVCPDTVAQSVDLLFEISGGPDYELAFPKPHHSTVIMDPAWATQMDESHAPTREAPAEGAVAATNSQANTGSSAIKSSAPPVSTEENQGITGVGPATVPPPVLDPARYCIGERCNSILQLMKRYSRLAGTYTAGVAPMVWLRPFNVCAWMNNQTIGTPALPMGDYYNLFAICFAYARGSMRLMLVPENGETWSKDSGLVEVLPTTDTAALTTGVTTVEACGTATNFQPGFGNIWPSGAQIPRYQQCYNNLVRPTVTGADEPIDIYSSPVQITFNVGNGATGGKAQIWRAGGDDLSLGYFLGTPLISSQANI